MSTIPSVKLLLNAADRRPQRLLSGGTALITPIISKLRPETQSPKLPSSRRPITTETSFQADIDVLIAVNPAAQKQSYPQIRYVYTWFQRQARAILFDSAPVGRR